MSFLDKLKSMFSGGSSTGAGGVQHTLEPDAARADDSHDHAHDHAHDHTHDHAHDHEPVAPPMPPADPAGMPTGEPQPAEPQGGHAGDASSGGSDSAAG